MSKRPSTTSNSYYNGHTTNLTYNDWACNIRVRFDRDFAALRNDKTKQPLLVNKPKSDKL